MQPAQSVKAGDNQLVFAGGFENMTRAPYFASIRDGAGASKFGPMTFEDHMQYDGLRCAFECWAMGNAADYIAKKYEISRADQDRFAARAHQLAAQATKDGWFKNEIVAVTGEQCMIRRARASAPTRASAPNRQPRASPSSARCSTRRKAR
jgi:acetyl-CoA C-acetyltransferase